MPTATYNLDYSYKCMAVKRHRLCIIDYNISNLLFILEKKIWETVLNMNSQLYVWRLSTNDRSNLSSNHY